MTIIRAKKIKRWLWLGVIAGLSLIVTACGPIIAVQPTQEPVAVAQPAVREEGVFKLGVLGPFTGPAAGVGDEFKGAVNMALEAANWQVGAYQIEPVWIDSQSDPEQAALAYEQAIVEAGIQAAILNFHSSVSVACMEVAAAHQIPHFFAFGATEEVNRIFASDPDKYGYWMTKGWPVPEKLTVAYVQAVEEAIAGGRWQPAEKTVAIYGENTAWGRSFSRALQDQLAAAGWTTVDEQYFELDAVLFYPLLEKAKAQNVALVAVTGTASPSVTAFIKQADEISLDSMIIADGLGWTGDWYQVTGRSSDYVIDQIPGWAGVEGRAFAREFEQRLGIKPSPAAAGLAYDGTNMFLQIAAKTLAENGVLSSQSLYRWSRENLQTGRWSYSGGIVMEKYQYTAETVPDPVVGKGYYIFPVIQYFEGQGYVVYPPEQAEQTLRARPPAQLSSVK